MIAMRLLPKSLIYSLPAGSTVMFHGSLKPDGNPGARMGCNVPDVVNFASQLSYPSTR